MRNKLSCIASIISRNFIFFIFLLFYVNTNAQITGKLSDSKNNIPYCNVLLLKSTDSLLITGATTDSVGLFQLEIKDTGSFYIQVDYFGYKRWKSNTITIPNKKYSLNLGTIMLEQDARSLKQIEVVAEKPFMEHKIDRTIYNIQNSIMGGGYNGLEVLKKLPGVTVNNNDEISVRGKSGVLLTIDGKTSYMSAADAANYLKSLDASQIEKIEVITNPSAKFDASGNAVINIVLVKDKNLGLNAQLYTGYSQGFYNSASVGGNANYRTKKFNFFANFNSYRFNSYNISDQKNIFSTNGLPSATFVDHIRQGINNKGYNGRAGVDYFINSKQTLGLLIGGHSENGKSAGVDQSDVYGSGNEPDSTLHTNSLRNSQSTDLSVGLNYKWKIDSTGKEFSANADYENYLYTAKEEDITSHSVQNSYSIFPTTLKYNLPENITIIAANADYEQPVLKNGKLEAGIKGSNVTTDNNAQYWNVINGAAINDTGKTNHFLYSENIYAGYLNFSKPLSKKVEIQIGLRGEGTESKGIQKINDSTVKLSYFKLFPSLFLNWKIDSSNTLNFSYSRRIDRPDYGQLNPFRFYRNPYTYGMGNPYLRPELSDNVGIDYLYKGFFGASLGFLHMQNVISDATHQNETTHILYTTTENLNQYNSYNILLSLTVHPAKWWTSTSSVNTFYDHYFGNSAEGYYSKSGITTIVNLQNSVNFAKNWSAEINVFYRSVNIAGYVVNIPIFTADGGIRKTFADGKGAIRLSCGDIFHSERYRNTEKFKEINFTALFYSDSQRLRISLSWKLGKSQYQREEKQKSAQEELNRIKTN